MNPCAEVDYDFASNRYMNWKEFYEAGFEPKIVGIFFNGRVQNYLVLLLKNFTHPGVVYATARLLEMLYKLERKGMQFDPMFEIDNETF